LDAREVCRDVRPAAQRHHCKTQAQWVFSVSSEREAFAGISPRLATHFLLLRQKKVSKERATPLSASLRFATGNLRCGFGTGNRSNSLRSDNRGSFSRPKPTAQAHTEGTQGIPLVALRATLHRGVLRTPHCNARRSRASSAAPHAVVRRRVAQGWADQGSRLSERSEFERDPAQTEQRSDGDAFGSPFFCLLFFGEAKKSESPAGARPGQQPHQEPKKG